MTGPIDERLLDHLDVEFGSHGTRAVEFLRTAWSLLDGPAPEPTTATRLPETIAYCLREAMTSILQSSGILGGGRWSVVSREVSDARRRYELARGMQGADEAGALEDLLAKIDDLDLVHGETSVHERRLIAIMIDRTGAAPVTAGTAPIETYHDLLVELNGALHNRATREVVEELWDRCHAILRQLFLPPDVRHDELDALARATSVTGEQAAALLPLIASPQHLRYFLERISEPEWLGVLTPTGILDPPLGGGWPAFAAIDRLKHDHGPYIASWLEVIYDRSAPDVERAWASTLAAAELGPLGAPLVLRAVRDHPTSSAMTGLAITAVEGLDAGSEYVESFADLLLNEQTFRTESYLDPLIGRLVEGADASNVVARFQLLCWKLATAEDEDGGRWFRYERAGSIGDWNEDDERDRFSVVLRAVLGLLRRSPRLVPTTDALGLVDGLSEHVRGRLRALILVGDDDVDVTVLVTEVAAAIGRRDPTGDDLPLLDRVVANTAPEQYADRWRDALGPAPTVVEVAQLLPQRQLPPGWLRAFHWVGLLPEACTITWSQATSVIAGRYSPTTRESLERRTEVTFGSSHSPMTVEQLQALTPLEASRTIAAWRPDPSDWLVSARELARNLELAVAANPAMWLASPVAVATALHHPTYIGHYLRAAADAVKSGEVPPVAGLMDVIGLVRAQPWGTTPLGEDSFDFDSDWGPAKGSAVDLVMMLADKDIDFHDRQEEAWGLLEEEARERDERSGIVSGARDPLDSAINRRSTRALQASLSFIGHEYRASGAVRPNALALIEEALRLEGTDGAEHRAIIGTRLTFLRHIAPSWFDQTEELIFGATAPEGLAQVTADMAIKWTHPNRWFLEHYRPLVRSAVGREVRHAMDQLMIAMLWAVPGYGVTDNVSFLKHNPTLLSKAGEMLGRLLRRPDAEPTHIDLAVEFWAAATKTTTTDGLLGFGWFSEIDALDDDLWADRTLSTISMTGGRIDWTHKVAERAASLAPSATTLLIMNGLIRGTADSWDRRQIIDLAVDLLRRAAEFAGTPAYERLRTTLLERGAL